MPINMLDITTNVFPPRLCEIGETDKSQNEQSADTMIEMDKDCDQLRRHERDSGFRGYGRKKLTIDDIRKELTGKGSRIMGRGEIREQIVDNNTTDYYSNYFLDI